MLVQGLRSRPNFPQTEPLFISPAVGWAGAFQTSLRHLRWTDRGVAISPEPETDHRPLLRYQGLQLSCDSHRSGLPLPCWAGAYLDLGVVN